MTRTGVRFFGGNGGHLVRAMRVMLTTVASRGALESLAPLLLHPSFMPEASDGIPIGALRVEPEGLYIHTIHLN